MSNVRSLARFYKPEIQLAMYTTSRWPVFDNYLFKIQECSLKFCLPGVITLLLDSLRASFYTSPPLNDHANKTADTVKASLKESDG